MRPIRGRVIGSFLLIVCLVAGPSFIPDASAQFGIGPGMPVFDAANFTQNTIPPCNPC